MATETVTMKHGKAWAGFQKLGVPVNKLVNKVGSEAFWPTSLDQESEKASRILKSFCKDGFYREQPVNTNTRGPKNPPKVLVKIPQQVIQGAVGLAIFSVGRLGTWGASLSGGSGVLIARKEDGTWSPPSAILVSTLGVGFMGGIDIYDCVIAINNCKALEAFSKLRFSLGGEASLTLGPFGAGRSLDAELLKDRRPIFTYMKSRGLYAGLQLDGTVIGQRNDENSTFYGQQVSVGNILSGEVKNIPFQAQLLQDAVCSAEGGMQTEDLVTHEEYAAPNDSYGDEKRQVEVASVAIQPEMEKAKEERAIEEVSDEKQDQKLDTQLEKIDEDEREQVPSPTIPPRSPKRG